MKLPSLTKTAFLIEHESGFDETVNVYELHLGPYCIGLFVWPRGWDRHYGPSQDVLHLGFISLSFSRDGYAHQD